MGVTFTFEEKVGSKLLAIIKASRRLKRSDHLLSISANFSSVLCFDIFVEGDFSFLLFLLSFLGFLSGGGTGAGDFTDPCPSTTPITDMLDGSTSWSESWEGVESESFASRFSFLSLYEGVDNCWSCSDVRLLHI